jgi:heptosyltransferase-3
MFSTVKPQLNRILIIRTDRIGDVILTLPMAQVVKKHQPDAVVGMLVREYTAEIVHANSAVAEIIHADTGGAPASFFSLVRQVRAGNYDAAIHTHPMFRFALIIWLAGIPLRVGTGYRWYSFLFNRKVFEHRKDARRHELEYNLNLLRAIGFPADGIDITPTLRPDRATVDRMRGFLRESGIREENELVLIHPGSGGSARDWPADRFGELAGRLAADITRRVLITGGPGEESLVRKVCEIGGERVIALPISVTLLEFAALAGCAQLFIANSTGPLHLAAAVGTPVVGLYPQITALSPARWGPYTDKKIVFMPEGKAPDCRLCAGGKAPCECMCSINVEAVYEASVRFLSKAAV